MKKGILFICISIVCLAIAGICLLNGVTGYSILAFTVALIFGLFGINEVINNRNPRLVYENKVKNDLNTFDSILLKCNSVPNMEGRNVIKVETIDDLVNVQYEVRKPICYVKQSESCSYVLLDEKEAYVYIEKLNDKVVSPVEIDIRQMKFKMQEEKDLDSEMLKDIDKTTIIKLSNKKSYRVSPIRKKEVKEKNKYEIEYLFDDDVHNNKSSDELELI